MGHEVPDHPLRRLAAHVLNGLMYLGLHCGHLVYPPSVDANIYRQRWRTPPAGRISPWCPPYRTGIEER